MQNKQRQAAALAAVMQFVGCLCAVFLAIFVSLEFTLLSENHYAKSLEKGGYFAYAQAAALGGCTRRAQAAGFETEPVEALITPEAVRAGVLHRADSLWHGATEDNSSPFEGLAAIYEDDYGQDAAASLLLEVSCGQQWQNATAAPYSALLAGMLQYKGVAGFVVWLCVVLLACCCYMQFLLSQNWLGVRRGIKQMAAGAGAACLILAALVYFASGWQSWASAADPARDVFCAWFGAFPLFIGVFGIVISAIMQIIAETMKNLTK